MAPAHLPVTGTGQLCLHCRFRHWGGRKVCRYGECSRQWHLGSPVACSISRHFPIRRRRSHIKNTLLFTKNGLARSVSFRAWSDILKPGPPSHACRLPLSHRASLLPIIQQWASRPPNASHQWGSGHHWVTTMGEWVTGVTMGGGGNLHQYNCTGTGHQYRRCGGTKGTMWA